MSASISTTVGTVKGVVAAIAGVAATAGVVAAFVTSEPTAPANTDILKPPMVEEQRVPNANAQDEPPPLSKDPVLSEVIPSPLSPLPRDVRPDQIHQQHVSSAKPSIVEQPPAEDVVRARQERASRLREESRSLGDAPAALRRGDAASALEKLEALGGQFPEGVLAQEREVLAIEALARAGQRTAASERAKAFLKAYPTSPHAKKVRGLLE